MTDAILDTSVLIDLLRAFPPATDWFGSLGRHRMAITPVVWMETVQGAVNREKRAQAIRFLRQFRVEHPTEDDNRWAMRQTASFHLSHLQRSPEMTHFCSPKVTHLQIISIIHAARRGGEAREHHPRRRRGGGDRAAESGVGGGVVGGVGLIDIHAEGVMEGGAQPGGGTNGGGDGAAPSKAMRITKIMS